jgi:hypothetical protein
MLVGKSDGRRPLGKIRLRLRDNSKFGFKEINLRM